MPNIIILCVDDDPTILRSIRDQLKRHFGKEFIIEIAERADEALEIVEEVRSDDLKIVISDWLMPGMKGDEFLIILHQKNPNAIKIMLTGHADQNAINNAFDNAHLYKCISKPWDEKTLITTIKEGLSNHLSKTQEGQK